MPKSLEKTRKQIAKKRNGVMNNLHENSRNARRLHTAQVRDERLEKLAQAKKKNDRPLIDRVAFFRDVVKESSHPRPLSLDIVHEMVKSFVHQYDEEYAEAKSARRPGRPASTKEDTLKAKVVKLEKEYQAGLYMPDLTKVENLDALERWEGSWSFLTSLAWVKFLPSGEMKPASFPPM
ncbi:hypothetical protein PpBr36_08301 [Pyricularia pennisetigena]|uniref:hypothetical protein n=1 Tax=Pyricularia pennisetigena TaxID=1578925 RepID=UPI0011533F73|nr:hypothetical protein PpBr36_08301 [Pyricularia pennisetigena]TLS24082.1 hypothetical protein PpBr36_08301 [Pyricularia pennisetigena]